MITNAYAHTYYEFFSIHDWVLLGFSNLRRVVCTPEWLHGLVDKLVTQLPLHGCNKNADAMVVQWTRTYPLVSPNMAGKSHEIPEQKMYFCSWGNRLRMRTFHWRVIHKGYPSNGHQCIKHAHETSPLWTYLHNRTAVSTTLLLVGRRVWLSSCLLQPPGSKFSLAFNFWTILMASYPYSSKALST